VSQQLSSRAWATAQLGRFARDGTFDIIVGSAVAGLVAYAYQVWSGRLLGAVDFAPFSALLTVHLLAVAIVLYPVEQLVVRRLSIDPDSSGIPWPAVAAIVGIAVVAGSFVLATQDSLFGGERWYAVAAAATVFTHALFTIGRGYLAGRRQYRGYGISSAAAGVLRLAITVVVVLAGATAVGLAWALILGPLVILFWRPFAESRKGRPALVADGSGRLLTGMIVAAAASQVLLLSGPLVIRGFSESEALRSTVYVTVTLFRAPLVFGYNLVARVLRPFTAMAAAGEYRSLLQWARGLVVAGTAAAALSGVGALVIGPLVVEIAFGSDFRPTAAFAGLVAAGVVAAGAGMFIGQVLVARGETARLAAGWMVAVTVGAAALLLPIDRADTRVGTAFLIGEAVAVAVLAVLALRSPVRAADG